MRICRNVRALYFWKSDKSQYPWYRTTLSICSNSIKAGRDLSNVLIRCQPKPPFILRSLGLRHEECWGLDYIAMALFYARVSRCLCTPTSSALLGLISWILLLSWMQSNANQTIWCILGVNELRTEYMLLTSRGMWRMGSLITTVNNTLDMLWTSLFTLQMKRGISLANKCYYGLSELLSITEIALTTKLVQ